MKNADTAVQRAGSPIQERSDYLKFVDDGLISSISSSVHQDSTSLFWSRNSQMENLSIALEGFQGLVDLRNINSHKRINKYLERINRSLEKDKYFVVPIETISGRKTKIHSAYPRLLKYLVYFLDFILHRIFPKTSFTKEIYFSWIYDGNRALSLTECLGRLKSCGFSIVSIDRFENRTYLVSQKTSEPIYDSNPTYGPLCQLERVGKDGKLIQVYKLRTMHPYSEYLQKYLFDKNGTSDGDKIIDDFRITYWGKIFRKFWIDELPMFYNFFKGDLKLVGIRPLSKHKFKTYPEWLQEKRTKVKPGLIPPYYADLPDTVEEFYETESKYLDAYFKHPYLTDIKYFFRALYNIFFKKARSK